jgi:nucleoside-diphosphate-sugar epimerase
VRDWLHIDDAVRLLWNVVSAEFERPPVVNGGTGEGVATAQVFDMVSDAWGGGHKAHFSGQSRKGDPTYLVADTCVSKRLGFNASVTLPEGIKEVVNWYKQEQM